MPTLTKLSKTLSFLNESPEDECALNQIRQSTSQMSDLALIHGFDGVQIISERISQSITRALTADVEERIRILRSVESSLRAVKTVLRLEEFFERRMTVEKIGRTVERAERKVRAHAHKALRQLEVTEAEDSEETEPRIVDSESNLFFDINDNETVIHLSDADESHDELEVENDMNSGGLV